MNVGKCPNTRKVVGVEEVNVVWQPTNSKYHNKNQKHFDNLQKKGQKSHNAARWSAEAIMEVSGYRMVGGVVCEGRKNTRWGIYG